MAASKRNKNKKTSAQSKADLLPDIEPIEGEDGNVDVPKTDVPDTDVLENADASALSDAGDTAADTIAAETDVDLPQDVPELPDGDEIPEGHEIIDAELVEETQELAALDGADTGADALEQSADELAQPELAAAAVAAAPPPKKGGFWGGMFGGIVAAAIGFGTSRYLTEDWPFGAGAEQADYQALIDEQTSQLTAQSEQIEGQIATSEDLAAQVTQANEQLDQTSTQLGQTAEQLDQTNTQLSETAEQLDNARAEILTLRGNQDAAGQQLVELTERFDGLAEINVGELPSDVQELIDTQRDQISDLTNNLNSVTELAREQIAELQGEMDTVSALATTRIASLQTEVDTISSLANQQVETAEQAKAQAEELKAQAAQAALEAEARGAVNEIGTALSNGGGFAEALPVIASATEVPEALNAVAEGGVETVQTLQSAFPQAARTALSTTTRSSAPEGLVGRLQVLAKDQLGARSLAPKEGDDPDAVLSRAEAAVRSGDLPAAIELVAQLPENAQEPFADWLEQAQARIDAQSALDSLTEALSAD